MRKKLILKNKNGFDWTLFFQTQEKQKAHNKLSRIADGRVKNREIYSDKQLLGWLEMQQLR